MVSLRVEDAKQALERMKTRIDWNPLRDRCQRGLGWNTGYTGQVLEQYQRYLALKVATEDWGATILSPPLPIDAMWHEHILDTKRYAQDCEIIMDRFLHHDADGDLNVTARLERVKTTKSAHYSLFYEEFPLSLETRDIWEDFGKTSEYTGTRIPNDDADNQLNSSPQRMAPTQTAAEYTPTTETTRGVGIVSPESYSPESVVYADDKGDSSIEGSSEDDRESADDSREDPENNGQHGKESRPVKAADTKRITVTICVKDRKGDLTFYKLRRTTRMMKVFQDYARRNGFDMETLRFSISGEAIVANDTPEKLQFVGEEIIDCAPSTPPFLMLVVLQEGGVETFFKVKKTVRMFKIFDIMAERIGVPAWKLTFFYRAIRIGRTDTAEKLLMNDQDQIECRVDPLGC